jgi:hypothetical protein
MANLFVYPLTGLVGGGSSAAPGVDQYRAWYARDTLFQVPSPSVTIPLMPADTPGRRVKVLAAGLGRLGTTCQMVSAEVSAAAAPSVVAVSPWQSTTATVNTAAAAADKDLTAIAQRLSTRGAHYTAAGARYTHTEQDSAGRLRGLVT